MARTMEGDGRGDRSPGAGVKLKTSAAAAFALVFGVVALFSALTAILSPLAIVFGVIAVILGVVGIKRAGEPRVTGKGVATGGLILGLLGLLLGIAIVAGAASFLTNDANLQRIEDGLTDLRDEVPTELPT